MADTINDNIINKARIKEVDYEIGAKYDSSGNEIETTYVTKTNLGSAKIKNIEATVDNNTGIPSVQVTSTGDQELTLKLAFSNLKGEVGDKGDPFTYSDFTQDELDGLKKPATDAVNELNKYLDIVKLPVVETPTSETALAMDANKVYDITIGETLTLTLNAPTDTTVTNEYQGSFDTGDTAPTVTFPSNVLWSETPTIEANIHYEFSIRYVGGKYYGLISGWTISTEESV